MKTLQLLFSLLFIFVSIAISTAQTVEVKSDYYDSYVDQTGKVEPFGDLLLISNATAPALNLNSVVVNFKLPAIPSGKSLIGASFTATCIRKDQWVSFNGDLYGINFRAVDVALGADYFSGAFTAGPNVGNGSDWGIMDNFLENATITFGSAITTTKATDDAANVRLISFLKQQYDNGAVNKYAFLRISMDNPAPATNWQRYSIASEANATYYPRLTLTFGVPSKVNTLEMNVTKLNVTADRKIEIELAETIADARLSIYTLTGVSVANEILHSATFTSAATLKQGAYIVKLSNAEKTVSRSIIVR
jgi:hypothetical protein